MDIFGSAANVTWRVLIIFSLALFGVVARKCGFLREEARSSFADVMLNITVPPLIFVSMTTDMNWGRLAAGMAAPAIALGLIGLVSAGTLALGKGLALRGDRLKTFRILCAMPNSGFIGYPVVLSIWGHRGLSYAVLYDSGTTIAFCSIAMMIMQSGRGRGDNWRNLLNPALAAVVCGLLVNWAGIKIPALITAPLQIMGDATVPLAMLLMGYILGGLKLRVATFNRELAVVCFFKLIIYPALAYLIMLPFHLDPLVRTVIIVEAAMPSMASTTVLVEKFGGDGELAATGILATTMLSVFTIPIIAFFLTLSQR